jgi:hypothetical protein
MEPTTKKKKTKRGAPTDAQRWAEAAGVGDRQQPANWTGYELNVIDAILARRGLRIETGCKTDETGLFVARVPR